MMDMSLRNASIIETYRSGQSLRETASLFDITHERVRQILTMHDEKVRAPHKWHKDLTPNKRA